jgi:hypothetical protein
MLMSSNCRDGLAFGGENGFSDLDETVAARPFRHPFRRRRDFIEIIPHRADAGGVIEKAERIAEWNAVFKACMSRRSSRSKGKVLSQPE